MERETVGYGRTRGGVNGFGFRIGRFDEERVETPEDYIAISPHQVVLLYYNPSGNQDKSVFIPCEDG